MSPSATTDVKMAGALPPQAIAMADDWFNAIMDDEPEKVRRRAVAAALG